MKHFNFSNGDQMPLLGLGTWKLAPESLGPILREAAKIGYRHFDCAKIYENQRAIGDTLRELLAGGAIRREEMWITSKLWNDCHSPEDVRPAVEKTLDDLGLDFLNLYLMHWPVAQKPGVRFPQVGSDFVSLNEIPLSETWAAMEELVGLGLVRHIGVSNFSVAKIENLLKGASIPPEMNQVESHPYLQQREMVQYCQQRGIAVTGYCPLGSPDRPEHLVGPDDPVLLEDPIITGLAQELGITPGQLLLAWAINRRTAVIPKSANFKRLAENFQAAEITLPDSVMSAISRIDRARRYVSGEIWTMEGSPYSLESLWDEAGN